MISIGRSILALGLVLGLVCFATGAEKERKVPDKGRNAFFAMDTGTRGVSFEQLSAIGYEGFGSTEFKGLDGLLEALDKNDLKLNTIYTQIDLDADQPWNADLEQSLPLLKGRGTMLWAHVHSNKFAKSSPDGDARAVEVLRKLADLTQPYGVRVALYPHTGFWVERLDDAVRVVKKVDRKNVGATFNLCHWLMVEGDKGLDALLERAMPYLFVVTINGADKAGTNWKQLIQTLDQGNYDTANFMATLRRLKYRGPVGLQAYGIGGDSAENLKRSMGAWKRITEKRNQ